jgi:sigma-B regulation protein RsbU (phosphoserine phosphatase)
MIPAKQVGGDFYDFFRLDDNRMCVLIADVSGKSISACLYMTVSKVLFNMFARHESTPSQVLAMINALLYAHGGDQFVTAFYGIIDFKEGTFSYCNAGHNHPYIVHEDGTVETLSLMGGVALGIGDPDSPFGTFVEEKINLKEGDFLYLYTDGVNEAMNQNYELFGVERLEKTLKEHSKDTANQIADAMVDSIKQHAQDMSQSDDITMLIVRYTQKKD